MEFERVDHVSKNMGNIRTIIIFQELYVGEVVIIRLSHVFIFLFVEKCNLSRNFLHNLGVNV